MTPNENLAKAISSNDIQAAELAVRQGAKMPRPSMKHPVFTWLDAMRNSNIDATPMLQWLVENGLNPAFRAQAYTHPLPRSAFSSTLSNKVASRHGDKGDSLLGRLIYCSQFKAANWLSQKVPAESLLRLHPRAVDTLDSPLERVVFAEEWGLVSTMLDRLQGYPLGEDEAANWRPIHERALQKQLSGKTLAASTQAVLDRIFRMSLDTGIRLSCLPHNKCPRAVSKANLEAWRRELPETEAFLFDKDRLYQRDGWEMLFSSPAAYSNGSGMLNDLLADPRFASVATLEYDISSSRTSDGVKGTLFDVALSGNVDFKTPQDRQAVLDLLLAANCHTALSPGTAFKYRMSKGYPPGDWLPLAAWKKHSGQLPDNAIAFCRRARQLEQLLSWGMDPSTKSETGVPAMVDLLKSMQRMASSKNLGDLAIAVGGVLEKQPELLSLACPETGQTVSEMAYQNASISSRTSKLPGQGGITPWALVSASLAGQKLSKEMLEWIKQQKGKSVVLPGTDMSPWFYCVLRETKAHYFRTGSQQNEALAGKKALAPLGRWPGECAMEGFRHLAAARDEQRLSSSKSQPSFTALFNPGELSASIRSSDDIALLSGYAVTKDAALLKLLHEEVLYMDTPTRLDLFCSWTFSVFDFIKDSLDEDSYPVSIKSVLPGASVISLLNCLATDVTSLSDNDKVRIMESAAKIVEAEREQEEPDESLLSEIAMRTNHISMHQNTRKAPLARSPGNRF